MNNPACLLMIMKVPVSDILELLPLSLCRLKALSIVAHHARMKSC